MPRLEKRLNGTHFKPRIALAMGDPAGISPELTAKVVANDDVRRATRLVVVGDGRIFDAGAKVAGVSPAMMRIGALDALSDTDEPVFVDLRHLDPTQVGQGIASKAGGTLRSPTTASARTRTSGKGRGGDVHAV